MGENLYWVWLSLGCLGHKGALVRLLRNFSSPREIFEADDLRLSDILGPRSGALLHLRSKDLSRAQRIMDYCMISDTGILTYGDAAYPRRLRMLDDPPAVLYYKGRLPVFEGRLFISVVGTRKMSDYGKRMTFEIAYDLTRAGASVVTGMALGVDGLASAAACAAGRGGVAFLGSGIDIAYPGEHAYLMKQIVKTGTVMTEYPPGTRPEGRNFPYRNRLMSGVSQGVLMIEGDGKSGALITARCAEQQGRDRFVLPGNADELNSEGSTLLLKNGAVPISCADDILRYYDGVYGKTLNIFRLLEPYATTADEVFSAYHVASRPYRGRGASNTGEPEKKKGLFPWTKSKQGETGEKKPDRPVTETPKGGEPEIPAADEAKLRLLDETSLSVYRRMPAGRAVSVDELCTGDQTAGAVMAALTILEIHKCVTSVAGGRYIRR